MPIKGSDAAFSLDSNLSTTAGYAWQAAGKSLSVVNLVTRRSQYSLEAVSIVIINKGQGNISRMCTTIHKESQFKQKQDLLISLGRIVERSLNRIEAKTVEKKQEHVQTSP